MDFISKSLWFDDFVKTWSRNIISHTLSCLVFNLNIKSQDDDFWFMFYVLSLIFLSCLLDMLFFFSLNDIIVLSIFCQTQVQLIN